MKNLRQRLAVGTLTAAAVAVPQLTAVPDAVACGGCFSAPALSPDQTVVQNAERVLFVRDEKTKKSTVWVEVRYAGLAKDFGWVLPVPKLPKVGVGSRMVFDALDQRMAMRYVAKSAPDENCRDPSQGCKEESYNDFTQSPAPGGAVDASASAADGGAKSGGGPAVEVLAAGATGPYDYVVIKGTDAKDLDKWLNDRGYASPKKAVPIIQSHADKGDVFVAIKLSNGQGVEAIRPVTLEMDDAEPCVPLRLTSIAAAEDMNVIVTVAGPGRAVVKNHFNVEPNPMRMAWTTNEAQFTACADATKYPYSCMFAKNQAQVVATAIDEAGGHAFVTEAALPGSTLKKLSPLQGFDLGTFAKIADYNALATYLPNSGLPITDEIAETLDPVLHLKTNFPKIAPAQTLANLKSCGTYWQMAFGPPTCELPGQGLSLSHDQLKALSYDGQAAAKGLKEGIIDPLFAVSGQLAQAGKVTRLAMRISPDEMDRDPVFAYNLDLADVDAEHGIIQFNQVCPDGWYTWYTQAPKQHTRISIDGLGSWVFEGNNAADPRFKDAPAALQVTVQEEQGAPVQIAKGQAGVVDAAIIGAKPGKPSLPKDLVLQSAPPWTPPKSDQLFSKVGPWHQPGKWCTPKDGWKDGQLPPATQSTGSDAGPDSGHADAATGTVPGIDAAGGWDDAQSSPDVKAAPASGSSKSSSSCTAGSSPSSGWVALLAAGIFWALRRRRAT